MDSNKIAMAIGGLLLAAFIALPLLQPQAGGKAGAPAAGAAGGATTSAAAPVSTGPNLTATDLAGSTWQATAPKVGQINVTLKGDGSFTAAPTSVIAQGVLKRLAGVDQIVGVWTLSGTSLNLSANAGGQAININGVIQGQNITVDGKPATRVQ